MDFSIENVARVHYLLRRLDVLVTFSPFVSQDNFWDFLYVFRHSKLPRLRKQAYSILLKIVQPEKENFQIKNSDIFHISAQNIDCGYSLGPPRKNSETFHISAQNIDCGTR